MSKPALNHDPASSLPSVEVAEGDDPNAIRRTGARPKISGDASSVAPPSSQPLSDPEAISGRPDALRKPYASLAPQARSVAPPAPKNLEAPPPPQWDDASSLSSTGRSRPNRAICQKHKLAKNPQGQCMMCEREAKAASAAKWKAPVLAVCLALLLGAALASLL